VTIAVTGVTGALGGLAARILVGQGVPQRLLAHTPARAPHLPGATVHAFDYADADASRAALTGVDTLLMVSAQAQVGDAVRSITGTDPITLADHLRSHPSPA